jgi:hypothetical protein
MSVLDEIGTYRLTERASADLEASGLALSEVYRVLRAPKRRCPGRLSGQTDLIDHGLVVTVFGDYIVSVKLDGTTFKTWEDRAIARARWQAQMERSAVQEADRLLREDAEALIPPVKESEPRPLPPIQIRHNKPPAPAPVIVTKIPVVKKTPVVQAPIIDKSEDESDEAMMLRIHPALRAEVLRQIDGDFSRLVIHTPTKVTILPILDDAFIDV